MAASDRLDRLLAAIADGTRRALLESLGTMPGATTTDLVRSVPRLSRWAVMKHLAVLESAGLVQTLPEGRLRRHFRDTRPLREMCDWVALLNDEAATER